MEAELRKQLQRAGHRAGAPGSAALVQSLAEAAAVTGLPARDLADRYDAYLLNRNIEGGKMSATVVDAFVAQLQRDAARGAFGGGGGHAPASGGGGGGGLGAGSSPAVAASAAALPASKWAARSWEELPDNFAGAAPPSHPQKDQQWPRPPSSNLLPGSPSPHAPAGGAAAASSSPMLVAAAMTPGGPAAGGSSPLAAPHTAFKQRANAGQVVSSLNAAPSGEGEGEGRALPELGAAAAASRQRFQRLLRDSKLRQQQQADGGAAEQQPDEERLAGASAVVLSAPPELAAAVAAAAAASSSSQQKQPPLLLPARGHRYMMERVEDKVAAVDGRITAFERALRAALRAAGQAELAGSELAPVGAPFIDDGDADGGGLFVGRVVSDASSSGAGGGPGAAPPPLNAASLLIEGGVASSDGARARLVLTAAAAGDGGGGGGPGPGRPAVRLFPGQVVGVRGFSPAGHTIFARQVYTHVPPPLPRGRAAAAAAAAASAAAAGAAAAAASEAAPAKKGDEEAAAAAAPMDLDAIVAAAGPGDKEGEQQPQEQEQQPQEQDKARQEAEAAKAVAAAAAAAAAAHAAAKKAAASMPPALSIVAAAGPFTCSDDLSYDPLSALLDALRLSPPDLLLLLGPFVDAEHPRVADGLCPCPLDALLSEGVAARVVAWRASLPQPHRSAVRVALVPSVRDASAHPTFPQPPLDLPGAVGLALAPSAPAAGAPASASASASRQQQQQQQQQQRPDAMVALQNPCAFVVSPPGDSGASSGPAAAPSAGGVLVAATTQDVLRHLAGSELALGGGGGGNGGAGAGAGVDRLSALASHLLGQRHLYPLYPAHASACLDTSRDDLLRLRARPDLLLLPSDLAPFARRVPPCGPGGCGGVSAPAGGGGASDDVLCVNPGRLAKGAGGGTYARIVVVGGGAAGGDGGDKAGAAAAAATAAAVAALPLADRARVEIVRV